MPLVTTPHNCLNYKKRKKKKKKKKKKRKKIKLCTLFKHFLCDILSSCNAQYFHTTEHTYTQDLPSWLVQ